MSSKLIEVFNMAEPEKASSMTKEEIEETIAENKAIIADANATFDKIDAALPYVDELDTLDGELDELADLAKERFESLIDLGLNVEARYSGHILATAGTLLGHAITAKQAKIDRKLRTIDMQLKKAKLDQGNIKSDGEKILNASDGKGIIIDRNELLKQILLPKK